MIASLELTATLHGKDLWTLAQTMPHLFSVGGCFYEQVKRDLALVDGKHYSIHSFPGKVSHVHYLKWVHDFSPFMTSCERLIFGLYRSCFASMRMTTVWSCVWSRVVTSQSNRASKLASTTRHSSTSCSTASTCRLGLPVSCLEQVRTRHSLRSKVCLKFSIKV